jgi:DNA-binding PadR family transcriptional regulator
MNLREKVFKTLAKHPSSSIAEVKELTKLPAKSGYVAVIFWSGVAAGHLKRSKEKREGRSVQVYSLTAAGEKALENGFEDGTGMGKFLKSKGWVAKKEPAKKSKKAKSKKGAKT